jgi:hypothetical protein
MRGKQIPAFAGMTRKGPGMTRKGPGMTRKGPGMTILFLVIVKGFPFSRHSGFNPESERRENGF